MSKVSNVKFLTILINLLLLIFISKAISLILFAYLPDANVKVVHTKRYNYKYREIDFKNILREKNNSNQASIVNGTNINNMLLKGLYGKNEEGYAIVSMKSKPNKTFIIKTGEIYNGYRLKSVAVASVIFRKSGKNYILTLEKNKKIKNKLLRTK